MLFSKLNLNRGEWLDLVFQNRNKNYGAYEIRKEADSYLLKAMFISFGSFALFMASVVYVNHGNVTSLSNSHVYEKDKQGEERLVKLEDFTKEIPVMKTEQPVKERAAPSTPQVNVQQVKYTVVRPVHGSEEDMPNTVKLENALIGDTDLSGPEPLSHNLELGTVNGRTVLPGDAGVTDEDNTTHNVASVELMPAFPGGLDAWGKFLRRHLQYPPVAKENGIQGKVIVSFIVEKDGSVTDVKVIRGIGGGCDEEAIRVIRKSPLWKPGEMNGRKVRVAYVIPVMFQLQ